MDFHFIEKPSLWSRTLNSHLEPCCYVTTVCLKPSPQKRHNKNPRTRLSKMVPKAAGNMCRNSWVPWTSVGDNIILQYLYPKCSRKWWQRTLSHPHSWALTKGESLGALVPCPFELMPSHFQRKDKIFYEGSLFLPGKVFLLRTF